MRYQKRHHEGFSQQHLLWKFYSLLLSQSFEKAQAFLRLLPASIFSLLQFLKHLQSYFFLSDNLSFFFQLGQNTFNLSGRQVHCFRQAFRCRMWLFLQNFHHYIPVYSDIVGSFSSDIFTVICRNKCFLILNNLSQRIPDHFQHKCHKRRAFIEIVRFIQYFVIPLICFGQSNLIGWGRATAEGGLVLLKDNRSMYPFLDGYHIILYSRMSRFEGR